MRRISRGVARNSPSRTYPRLTSCWDALMRISESMVRDDPLALGFLALRLNCELDRFVLQQDAAFRVGLALV